MEKDELPDVQSALSPAHFKITRVGVRGVKKLIHVKRPGMESVITLPTTLDLFVDLPATQKGSHMSRNIELANEIVETSKKNPVTDLETFCAEVAKSLLKKHSYATFAEVKAVAEYFLERVGPAGRRDTEPYKLIAEVHAERDGRVRKLIGVEVIGMTACPCAMEVVRTLIKDSRNALVPTHNQRNISTLMVEVPDDSYFVEANDLIEIVEKSFSSPTYGILKRKEEGKLVIEAHKNPKFVEDVVRDMLTKVLEKYGNLPDDTLVIARSESEESIHKHNAFAERVTTLGELKK
ncbi:MAG TPA: GTP cyclohydrolase I FolE2 [Thermoplasmatales archaeon]|nr:GTP cyclohydrolase I FolE2 [Thermoplasmatales archaeon]